MTLTRETPQRGRARPGAMWGYAGALAMAIALITVAFLPFCGVGR